MAEADTALVQPSVDHFTMEESDADERQRRLAIMEHIRKRHLSSPDFHRRLSLQSRVEVKEVEADTKV